MALLELGGGGAHTHTRLTVTPAPGAFLTTNFDGLHSEGALIGPTLVDSVLEHIGDDFVNVQNSIDVVLGWQASGGSAGGQDLIVADASFGSTFPLPPGDTAFRFFEPQAGNVWATSQLWAANVCSARLLEGAAAAPWKPLATNASAAFFARYGWAFSPYLAASFALYALQLCPDAARPPPPAALGYTSLAQVNSSCCTSVRNNFFADGLGRVGPFNSPHSVFQGNIVRGTLNGGLLLSAELTWLSGNLGIDDVLIADNVLTDCCSYMRLGYPGGQCNATGYPVFLPGGATNVTLVNNTVT